MKKYDRVAAANYATKHAFVYNPKWPDFSGNAGGGDCANFVSQALHAGGWPMIPPTVLPSFAFRLVLANPTNWFCSAHGCSFAWGTAKYLNTFLSISGRARSCEVGELELGDVVLLENYGIIYHAMLVTYMLPDTNANKVPHLSYHTNDVLNKPITALSQNILVCWKINDQFEK